MRGMCTLLYDDLVWTELARFKVFNDKVVDLRYSPEDRMLHNHVEEHSLCYKISKTWVQVEH
jgi:hypothetical protein